MEQLAQALQQAYGLKLERAHQIDFGIWEDSFAIWTDQGRYYAKHFRRKERLSEYILRGLRLSQQLNAQGFPAPAVVPTRTGELLAEVHGERYYVTEWVEGRSYHPGDLPLAATGPMGAVLGRLHRLLAGGEVPAARPWPAPCTAAAECRELLAAYAGRPEPFASFAREVLDEQIRLLEALPVDFAERLPLPTLGGLNFNSFWVEQLLFKPSGEVAAVVDWSDGAGKPGLWASDIDLGMHLSALNPAQIAAYVAGYQAQNPLPEREWRAIAAGLCYGHLASINYLGGWLDKPYRRLAAWEETSQRWHGWVPERYRRWEEIEALMLTAAGTGR